MKRIRSILVAELLRYKWQLAGVIVLILLTTAFQVLTPWPFKLLIDNILGDELLDVNHFPGILFRAFQSKETLGIVVVFLYFFTNILASIFEYLESNSSAVYLKKVMYGFSQRAFANMQEFDYGYFRKQDIGDYIYRLSYDVSAIESFIEVGVLPILTAVIFLVATTAILFTIDVQLTLMSLVILPILALSVYLVNRLILKATSKSETSNSILYSFVQQALSQLKIIQAYSQERAMSQKYDAKMLSSLEYEYTLNKMNFVMTLVIGLLISICYSTIIGYGIKSIFAGHLSSGLLIVFIFYLDNLTQPIISILYSISSAKQSLIRIKRLAEFFNPTLHVQDSGTLNVISDTTVNFNDVTLLGSNNESILRSVSCTFSTGHINAVIGTSGSGKSSLTSLLLRLIDHPDKGTITIGGHSIADYTLTTLRGAIAYVPQEPILSNDTIERIIAFGKPDATFEDITRAAKLAGAHEFILAHPRGYQFKVGDQGNMLSGGQRQRLMLARGYVRDAKILILDEVFAGQDPTTRQIIMKHLREYAKGRTVIVVTNILDILDDNDTVVLVDHGNIRKTGIYRDIKNDHMIGKIRESHTKGGD